VCAAVGGELFVRGLLGVAWWLRLPASVIGATVAAFATSSPELTVGINAAADDRSEIALGDALGSNIVNIGLVVGLLLLAGAAARDLSRRDTLTALGLTVLMGFLVLDGELQVTDGVVLLVAFAGWLAHTLTRAFEQREDQPSSADGEADDEAFQALAEHKHGRSVVEALFGLVFLVAAGRLLIVGAKGLGDELGLSTFVVGVVLVSFGTSLPELATAISARLRGHTELGLGTLLGSNIFNTSFIVGIATVISPIDVQRRDVWISLGVGAAMLAVLVWRVRGVTLGRWRGVVLISMYIAVLVVLLALQA